MLLMWVIYEKPSDYPEHFVVRRWTLDFIESRVDQTAGEVTVFDSLDDARASLPEGAYLVQGKGQDSDPVICEVWM